MVLIIDKNKKYDINFLLKKLVLDQIKTKQGRCHPIKEIYSNLEVRESKHQQSKHSVSLVSSSIGFQYGLKKINNVWTHLLQVEGWFLRLGNEKVILISVFIEYSGGMYGIRIIRFVSAIMKYSK